MVMLIILQEDHHHLFNLTLDVSLFYNNLYPQSLNNKTLKNLIHVSAQIKVNGYNYCLTYPALQP